MFMLHVEVIQAKMGLRYEIIILHLLQFLMIFFSCTDLYPSGPDS